ncbi:ScbR family autoregulator-binding transcription factor [Streptomyces sp. NPDC001339]|uniref:ScbR family autoregulator-binding transcription factor n=1 Tax=Streptomyces sp. NPDC001339 TaxID=3364563 RepID=UPI0036CB001A
MAKQERAIPTRRACLEAAAEIFNEYGYEGATIAAVLERAQLTRAALYFHFTSKEELAHGVLAEGVTTEGLVPQPFKLQEWVDISLLLAHRLPREPVLKACIRLSVDPKARSLLGTRWPDWIALGGGVLMEAKARGELYSHIDPTDAARLLIGAWTGVQLITEAVPNPPDLCEEISRLLEFILPNVAVPGVLARLDTSPFRAERLLGAERSTVVS